MADLFDVADTICRMADGFEAEVMRIIGTTTEIAAYAVTEQLYSGLSGDDSELSPNYDNDGFFNEEFIDGERNSWYGRSEDYKGWKRNITPPRKGKLLGTPPRAENVPNLYIDGTFHSKIYATVSGDELSIRVEEDLGTSAIVEKWGENILRLGSYAIDHYTTFIVGPGIWKFFEGCGW